MSLSLSLSLSLFSFRLFLHLIVSPTIDMPRRILNQEVLFNMMQERYNPLGIDVVMVDFAGLPWRHQIEVVQQTSIYLCWCTWGWLHPFTVSPTRLGSSRDVQL
eukprot:TRINITY_DN4758_c0_g1_i8.p1 TRINITY_DN4758_c0_g1~~TRINITY_DN4758_c0_g1_i8.p1  ORF type:complete len:112 (+),score=12.63 TRINITY_DN4758_c0_g1_i8:26-337(+)